MTPKRRFSRRTVSIRGEIASTGTFGPVGGDEPRGAAAVGRHDQRRQPEPVDGADRALGDRVGDVLGRLVGAVEEPLAVGEVGLGRPRDLVHHPDRLDRVAAPTAVSSESITASVPS